MADILLNIISNSIANNSKGGPSKVVRNTLKGLEKLNYPFVLNMPLDMSNRIWIHDSPTAMLEVAAKRIPALLGPNLFVLPRDFPWLLPSLHHCIFLHPSEWTIRLWEQYNFNRCPIISWPAGIDTNIFSPTNRMGTDDVMIYFKKRDKNLLEYTIRILRSKNLGYRVITYGSYDENTYIKTLEKCRYGIWIGTTESQGIAMLEALATNLPLIVLNTKSILENEAIYLTDYPNSISRFEATSVPYFNNNCGLIINDIEDLEEAVNHMELNIEDYEASEYIRNNLSLEISTKKLLEAFDLLPEAVRSYRKFLLPLKLSSLQFLFKIKKGLRMIRRQIEVHSNLQT